MRLELATTFPLITSRRYDKHNDIPIVRVDNRREGFLEYDDAGSVLDALPRSLRAML